MSDPAEVGPAEKTGGVTLSPMAATTSRSARICWGIERNQWVLAAVNLVAAVLFVFGCVAFYSARFYVLGVSLFLAGSLLMVTSSAADLYRRFGPSS